MTTTATRATSWFLEYINADIIHQFRVKGIIYTGKSEYQDIQIIDTYPFGRCLVLDGKIQSSEADECVYHEALVHPAMLAHPNPRTVFVGGGGEGATLREVLRHKSVEKVVMIDLDEEVVNLCRKHLPAWHQGSFDDKRVKLLHVDALKYLEETKEKFDVMIMDFTEPLEEGPAYLLFTREFYQDLKKNLTPDGLISLQSGATSTPVIPTFLVVTNTLKAAYPIVAPYQAEVASFSGSWGFGVASLKYEPRALSATEIDARISSRISGQLRYYDGITHQAMFSLPKYMRQMIAAEKRVITKDNPFFTF